mgnify:CR=1 FL=1
MQLKHGGGSVWETATYDAESDTFYQGIGNAGPDWDPEYRPGDNKWAASVLALSPSDGKIKWGYQYTPNDPYDFDEISEHPVIDVKVNGVDRKLVVHSARNGFHYALDRTNGSFVAGKQYVDQLNWTTGLDPKTGRPLSYDPTKDVQLYIKPTTLRVAECGFAVSCSRAELQRVLSEFHQQYVSMQQAYRDRGEYPMNCPVEIRVTGIDRPEDCLVPGAQVPLLSAARPWPVPKSPRRSRRRCRRVPTRAIC